MHGLDHLAGFHRTAGDEHHRNIQAHRGHQHAGRNLVAIGDADHRIGAMCIDHVFDRIGDQLARRQRIQHAAMPHRDAVIDGDGVEFLGDAAGCLDFARHHLAQIFQMDVTRDELGERIDDSNDGLAKIAIFHAGGAPECAGAGHIAAMSGGTGTVLRHVVNLQKGLG